MSKQTAVQWLQEQLNPDMKTMQGNIIQNLLEQALQMECEQIVEAYNESFRLRDNPYAIAEKYYNETYGGKE